MIHMKLQWGNQDFPLRGGGADPQKMNSLENGMLVLEAPQNPW